MHAPAMKHPIQAYERDPKVLHLYVKAIRIFATEPIFAPQPGILQRSTWWAVRNGLTVVAANKFGTTMKKAGFRDLRKTAYKDGNRPYMWICVEWKREGQNEEENRWI